MEIPAALTNSFRMKLTTPNWACLSAIGQNHHLTTFLSALTFPRNCFIKSCAFGLPFLTLKALVKNRRNQLVKAAGISTLANQGTGSTHILASIYTDRL